MVGGVEKYVATADKTPRIAPLWDFVEDEDLSSDRLSRLQLPWSSSPPAMPLREHMAATVGRSRETLASRRVHAIPITHIIKRVPYGQIRQSRAFGSPRERHGRGVAERDGTKYGSKSRSTVTFSLVRRWPRVLM